MFFIDNLDIPFVDGTVSVDRNAADKSKLAFHSLNPDTGIEYDASMEYYSYCNIASTYFAELMKEEVRKNNL